MITLEWVKPSQIRDTWPAIKEGLKKIEKSTDAWIVEDIYMAIKMGTCNLHVASIDGEYKGFLIVQQQENYGVIGLHIWAAYSNGMDFNILDNSMEQVKEWAKNVEAKKITFSSTRKGWTKQALKLGFQASPLITYQLRLNHD